MVLDETIKTQIVDQLNADLRIDASDVKITVNNGQVHLEGKVPSYLARQEAVNDAWLINGVNGVENDLQIDISTPPPLPTDDILETRVENYLLWNDSVDSSDIDVSVNSAIVSLEGHVDSYWEKLEAGSEAFSVRGVVDVNNELAVIPTEKITDEIIADNVIDSMKRNIFINVDEITVKVENGNVTLTGTVSNRTAKDAAFNAALYTAGVIYVKNDIVVLD